MSRVCTVCTHADLQEINRQLVCGEPIADVARKYALSWDAVDRHRKNHLPDALVASPSAEEVTQADNLLAQIEQYKTEINEMKDEARAGGNLDLALKAIDRALKAIELQSKVQGLIDKQPQVNVAVCLDNAPEWLELRTLIVTALKEYPVALEAVRHAIQ